MIKIYQMGQMPDEDIFARGDEKIDIGPLVSEIIEDVRKNGDAALLKYADKFDGGAPDCLEVSETEIDEAFERLSPEFIEVLKKACKNIEDFHRLQVRKGFEERKENGVILGQRVLPLERVGLYVPGGTASYPSSVLMNCVPAKIAEVFEIVMVTPAKGGRIPPAILAAAKIAGVDRIFKTGGAQAVAALAYGTGSVPRVDKIVGPGNAYVAEAKRQVFGAVDIDMIAGPSEILVIADGKSNPAYVAADMLSQAEHDKLASAVLATDSMALANAVAEELEHQLKELPREEIARHSIENYGKVIVCKDLDEAIAAANRIAPEHLEIVTDNPFYYLDKIKNAGSVFLGRSCPEAVGDYYSGCNHTLPTSGTARFSSPLSVDDFIKTTQYMYYSEKALGAYGADIALFAGVEGLAGHARSVTRRLEDMRNG